MVSITGAIKIGFKVGSSLIDAGKKAGKKVAQENKKGITDAGKPGPCNPNPPAPGHITDSPKIPHCNPDAQISIPNNVGAEG